MNNFGWTWIRSFEQNNFWPVGMFFCCPYQILYCASPGDDVRRRAILHAVEEHEEHTREHLECDEHESLVLLKNCSVFCSISSFYCVVQE